MEVAVATVKQAKDSAVKQRIQDIQMLVSWREIAHTYFEKNMLRGALCEASNRIRAAADRI